MSRATATPGVGRIGGPEADRAALVALVGLPGVGPGRLAALLAGGEPARVWAEVRAGRRRPDEALVRACGRDGPVALLQRWRVAAERIDAAAVLAAHRAAGLQVVVAGDPGWPTALLDDPDPPALLFARGDLAVLAHGRRAAVVGTRRCSRYGIDVATRLGADLSAAGVAVVSGLAAGIDGAAHRGVLGVEGLDAAAAPIGVVATGLDLSYPRGHRGLADAVAARGVLVSEAPLGTPPSRWRFPARNRIIAGLSEVVVVVESAAAGGALLTVDEALRRDRPVLAVPGPVTSRASAGTNRLLADGAAPACSADDVLLALGEPPRRTATPAPGGTGPAPPAGALGRVYDAIGWQPVTLDQVVLRTGLGLGAVAGLLEQLEQAGWVAADGGWFERRR